MSEIFEAQTFSNFFRFPMHAGIGNAGRLPVWLDLLALVVFCTALLGVSLRNVKRKWIV